MVDSNDLKVFKTTNNLGGAITATQIPTANPNNLFTSIPKNELVVGEDYYACAWWKNNHATEVMQAFKLWITNKSFPHDTEFKWSFDPLISPTPTVNFDGTDDRIDMGDDAELWSQSLTKFSVAFRIFPAAGSIGDVTRDIMRHGGVGGGRFRCDFDLTTGDTRFYIRNIADTTDTFAIFSGITASVMHSVVCTYDQTLGSANVKIYVDGVLGATTGNLTETIPALAINMFFANNSTDYKGAARDFRWWSFKALSQTEVTAYHNNAQDAPQPDYWLPMNEGTGNPKDIISGTKVGTLQNGAAWNTNPQTIADKYTSPLGVTWKSLQEEPTLSNFGDLGATKSFPIWYWYHVNANAVSRVDDSGLWAFNFLIPQGGSGSPGGGGSGGSGGSGGNPPPTATDYKIAFAGDWGCESATDDVLDLIRSEGYNFIVGTGDNSYDSSASCWRDRFRSFRDQQKFISAYGNHEYSEGSGNTSLNQYKDFLGSVQGTTTYFTKQFQNFFFLVLDANISIGAGSTQRNFIISELERVKNDNTITWKAFIMHHPWFGAGGGHAYNEDDQAQNFHPLAQQYGVQFVVCGHNHNWQRTFQVGFKSSNPTSPNVVDNTSPYSRTQPGVIHVVSGTGGHDSGGGLYGLGTQPAFQAFQNRTHNGVWELVASNSGQTLTGRFREIGGDTFDEFVINA